MAYVTGWRDVSAYSGATNEEIAEAICAGELRCQIKVKRRHLRNWIRSRTASEAAFPDVADQGVQLVS